MRIFSGFTMFFYTLVFLAIGCALIVLSLNVISVDDITRAVEYVYNTMNVQWMLGLIGLLVIIYSMVAVQVTLGALQREKTIAFENPSGRVTISLSAIEDFIKRTASHIPEVKELRPNVIASKKGINIVNRVVIYSDANIPEITEKIQSILKNRIQEMLGIEEPINIKMHIAKIVSREKNENKVRTIEQKDEKKAFFRGIEYGNS